MQNRYLVAMGTQATRIKTYYRLYRRKFKSGFFQLRTNRPTAFWIFTGLGSIALLGCLFLVGTFILVRFGALGSIPSSQQLKNIKNHEASQVLDYEGALLGKYYRQNRLLVSLEDMNPDVVNALISVEDSRFYQHSGIDYKSWGRVLVKTILSGNESSGGGSTITQQLAKNLYPRKRYRLASMLVNKYREFIIAKRLEQVYNKEQILHLYLNTVPFSENTFGIKVASQRFFSKTPMELSVGESALLIGSLKATASLNPRKYPERSKNRRDVVLRQMERSGYLNSADTDSLIALPVVVNYSIEGHDEGLATHFRELVRAEASTLLEGLERPDRERYNLYSDGLQIHTTIDKGMQKHAEQAVSWHMKRLQNQFDEHWQKGYPWYKTSVVKLAMKSLPAYKEHKISGKSEKEILKTFREKEQFNFFSWDGYKDVQASIIDSIEYYNALLNAGFVVMDKEGAVKAWVGGISYKDFQYDMVTSKRQVGSTFKPLVYATALQDGIDPCELIGNHLTIYTEYDDWKPENANGQYGGYHSVLGGIVGSINTVAVNLIMKTGIPSVIALANNLGISSSIPEVPSIALGTANLSLLEMTGMYQSFANEGVHHPSSFITKITNSSGEVIVEVDKTPPYEAVLSDTTAQLMTEMMQMAVNSGTGRSLIDRFGLTNDIAGKTGTTQAQADGWFIGYTPNLIGGVRVGASSPEVHFNSLALGQGGNMALPIFGKFMTNLKKDKQYRHLLDASFEPLDTALTSMLSCPLYLSEEEYAALQEEEVWTDIFETILEDKMEVKDFEELIERVFKPRRRKVESEASKKIRKKNERLKRKRDRQRRRNN